MSTPVKIPFGNNLSIEQDITSIRVNIISGPAVELVASIAPDPTKLEPEHSQATSVAIHMDQAVATILFEHLRETFRSMGWPPPK